MPQIMSETATRNPVVIEMIIKELADGEPKKLKWTKAEYHSIADLGFFEGKRTEFLEGEIIEMPTMNSPHVTALEVSYDVLRDVFKKNFAVRNQSPIDFGAEFEAVPDIAVVKGNARDFRAAHPQTADLIVEISGTTLSYDRNRKASLYAKFGILDYWILNLRNRTLEVYRHPSEDDNIYYGFGYADITGLDMRKN